MDQARQIVAELAVNAAVHGRVPSQDFRLTLYVVANTLRIEMTDTRGDRLSCLGEAAQDAESDRGLLFVEVLADRWGLPDLACARRSGWS